MFLSVLAGADNGYKHLSLVTVLKVERHDTYGKMCTSGLQWDSYDVLILRKGYGSSEEGVFCLSCSNPYGTLEYLILSHPLSPANHYYWLLFHGYF